MKVLGYDIVKKQEFSDFISIHVPFKENTYHLIGCEQFKQMKKNAVLINVSRGSIVDENALYNALKNNTIAGVALDVFESKLPKTNSIFKLENVVCTPHIAAYTNETLRFMDFECINKLAKFLI